MSERDPNAEPFDFDFGGDVEARIAEFLRLRNAGGTIIVSFEEHLAFSELVAAGYSIRGSGRGTRCPRRISRPGRAPLVDQKDR